MSFEKKEYGDIVESCLSDLTTRSQLSDTNVGSVTRTLLETVSMEVATLYNQLEAAYNAGFVDTAEGKALDLVVAILGIQRKGAQFATGTVTFSRRKAVQAVTVMQGTRVSTRASDPSQVKIFETTITAHLDIGENEIEVPIRALVAGEEGVADFETITELESPIIGIDSVLNKKPTTVGSERETDEELRSRAKTTVLSAGKATVESIRNAVLGVPGVRSVTVNDMPEGVPGEIDVIIDGLDLTDRNSQSYLDVYQAIQRRRPIGIQVNIKATTIVRTYAEVWVKLKESIRTDEETQAVCDEISESITSYINDLKCGEPILRNRIITAILGIKDVYNVDDLKLTTKIFDEKLGGLVEDTLQRTDPKSLNITVGPKERAQMEWTLKPVEVFTQYSPRVTTYVHIDLDIVCVLASKTLAEKKIKERIEFALYIHFQRLKGGEDIDYDRVKNIIKNVEDVTDVKEMKMSAFHEETGLVITETTGNIKTGENETPKLRHMELHVL